ncbi:hypothetical protein J1N35_033965 [Gossypium stocksii]|uniref:Reverse transcriptase n=1 Tax=Gossypium stocksii TaxID=47602 RepID=A0A9D3ZQ53_9ROSI|nr:hypothetical protein J1N35_033965 [Gossypium stocksii]
MEMDKGLEALKGKHTSRSRNSKHDKKKWHKVRKYCSLFNDFIEIANLQDLGFKRPNFRWHREDLYEGLDRAIGNDTWLRTFSYNFVAHLSRIKSDHRQLLLCLKLDVNFPKGCPFRFLAGWVEHPSFQNFFKERWCLKCNIVEALNIFTRNIKEWNNSVYDFIGIRKRKMM